MKTIAQIIIEEANGDSNVIDRLSDERMEEIQEQSDATLYIFSDGSRIRVWFEGAEIVS